MPVLVAYASKFGSTEEIAGRIAAMLKAEGLTVSLEPAGVTLNPSDYDAIVLGGDVVGFRWAGSSPLLRRGKAADHANRLTRGTARGRHAPLPVKAPFVMTPGTQGI